MTISKGRFTIAERPIRNQPLVGPLCRCRTEFFRQEFLKHHQRLEEQREYFSEGAITRAEDALANIMNRLEAICQRDDACEVVGQLLRSFDTITGLSAWTEPDKLN